jgi:hypothetical protein
MSIIWLIIGILFTGWTISKMIKTKDTSGVFLLIVLWLCIAVFITINAIEAKDITAKDAVILDSAYVDTLDIYIDSQSDQYYALQKNEDGKYYRIYIEDANLIQDFKTEEK